MEDDKCMTIDYFGGDDHIPELSQLEGGLIEIEFHNSLEEMKSKRKN